MEPANPIHTISYFALFGFLISLSKIGNKTTLIALISYGLLPMSGNTYTDTGTDPEFSGVMESRGNFPVRILRKIKFPHIRPVILSGLRNEAS